MFCGFEFESIEKIIAQQALLLNFSLRYGIFTEKMSALETQVGQIYLSNKSRSRGFVSLQSEKVEETGAEIYVLLEIGGLTQKNLASYESIAKMIIGDLKKNFIRKNPNSFENAIAQINTDLPELISKGNDSWVGKFAAALVVREEQNLSIATTGKVHAFLLRSGQISDLADSPAKPNPLKVFENFALGRIKQNDFLVLSTSELFNYISLDKFKAHIEARPLVEACQKIADSIKDQAEQSVSFGTFILEFTRKGEAEPAVYELSQATAQEKVQQKIKEGALSAAALATGAVKYAGQKAWEYGKHPTLPKIPKIDPKQLAEQAKQFSDIKRIKELPKQKKFFLISAVVFLLLLIVNIGVLAHANAVKKHGQQLNSQLNAVQEKISQANASSIYNTNPAQTLGLLYEAQEMLDKVPDEKVISQKRSQTASELENLIKVAGHIKTVEATEDTTYKFTSNTESYNSVQGIPNVGMKISDSSKVYATKNFFYILDPSVKRLIVIDKRKSAITAQYGSTSFTNPQDFAITDDAKNAYIVNDSKVLKINLN